MNQDKIIDIRNRIAELRLGLQAPEVRQAGDKMIDCRMHVSRSLESLSEIELQLEDVPSIEIAFLGPSRHGKSTLMNELASVESLLPTSDTKPCTASVVRIRWQEQWSLNVRFIESEQLRRDWGQAVADAEEYLKRKKSQDSDEEAPDDRKFFQSTLQRFIHLFGLDPHDEPHELLEKIRNAKLPKETAQFLGKEAHPKATSLKAFQAIVREYLSTEGKYWTIVERCDICGPFENWHPKLTLIDLPGTNDTDPHRSAVTNSLQSNCKAISIVTSDSNLGNDIQSWLQDSTVLSDFLEAKESRRQRLFIIRSKVDAHLPSIDPDAIDDSDEESEALLRRDAMDRYQRDQRDTYHCMLKDIVVPMLPDTADSGTGKQKRQELLHRVDDIPVFFVSSQAHAAFTGRLKATKRELRNLKEDFYDDPLATGLPGLRDYLNEVAEEYLAQNHYDDLEARLESEAAQLANYFQSQRSTVQAELNGAGSKVRSLVSHIQQDVIPWIDTEVHDRVTEFHQQTTIASRDMDHRLDQVWAMSERRLADKTDKWSHYAWNSLRAMARKDGTHTRADGVHIDVNQDICSVLVDDLILAWTSYRDYLIDDHIGKSTDDLAAKLQEKLRETLQQTADPDAKAALDDVLSQLNGITREQRQALLRKVDAKIQEFESIRKPAYSLIRETLRPTYEALGKESGQGCQARMRKILIEGFQDKYDFICGEIGRLVRGNIHELGDSCAIALQDFGKTAVDRIASSMKSIAEMPRQDQTLLKQRILLLTHASAALPAPRE